jgi:hypothetical protein
MKANSIQIQPVSSREAVLFIGVIVAYLALLVIVQGDKLPWNTLELIWS